MKTDKGQSFDKLWLTIFILDYNGRTGLPYFIKNHNFVSVVPILMVHTILELGDKANNFGDKFTTIRLILNRTKWYLPKITIQIIKVDICN
jgi:hypothetical protein